MDHKFWMSRRADFLLLRKITRYAVEKINGTKNVTKTEEKIIMKYLLEGLFLGHVKNVTN